MAWGKILEGQQGVTLPKLAKALGCSIDVIKKKSDIKPTGRVRQSGAAVFSTYDPALIGELADDPAVRRSRERRAKGNTDEDRFELLRSLLQRARGHQPVGMLVQGFRSLRSTWVPLDHLTVLFGKNGAGKTSILDALALAVKSDSPNGQPAQQLVCSARLDLSDDDIELRAVEFGLGLPPDLLGACVDIVVAILRQPSFVYKGATSEFAHGGWQLALVDEQLPSGLVHRSELNAKARGLPADLFTAAREARSRHVSSLPLHLRGPIIRLQPLAVTERHAEDLYSRVPAIGSELWPARPASGESEDLLRQRHLGLNASARSVIKISWLSDRIEGEDPLLVAPSRADRIKVELPAVGEALTAALGAPDDMFALVMWVVARRDEIDETEFDRFLKLTPWLAHTSNGVVPTLWHEIVDDADSGTAGRSQQRWRPLAALLLVEQLANSLAPPFVADTGRICLRPPTGDSMRVGLGLLDPDGEIVELEQLPAGAARWMSLLVAYAGEQARRRNAPIDATELDDLCTERGPLAAANAALIASLCEIHTPGVIDVVCADEPELHLHPSAQEEVVRWCLDRSRNGTVVVVATHAPPFLRLARSGGSLVRVVRQSDGGTAALPLDSLIVERLDELAESLGLGRDALIQLQRGLVVVEGPVDRLVLLRLAGEVIGRQRLVVVPLHGHTRASALIDSEFAAALGMPIAVIFDNVLRDDLAREPGKRDKDEVKSARKLMAARDRGLFTTVIPFEEPDIIAGLPENAVRRVCPSFHGWAQYRAGWAGDNEGKSFKAYSLERLQWSKDDDQRFVEKVLEAVEVGDAPSGSLQRTIKTLDAWADNLGVMPM